MRFRDTNISEAIRTELCPDLQKKIFSKNQIIFLRDDPGDDVYFVVSGSAKAITLDADGNPTFFMDYEAGDIFGYYAAFTKKPRTATLISQSDLVVCSIPAKIFMNFLSSVPERMAIMMEYMAAGLRNNSLRMSRNSTQAAPERVAALLIFLMEEHNSKTIPLRNREDFSSQLDLTRETLSRILNKMAKDGIILLETSQIEILNIGALYEMVSAGDSSR